MHQSHLQLTEAKAVRHRGQDGYTTIELLSATFLGLAALAAILGFNRFQLYALRNQASQLELQTIGRNFIDLFSREVRRVGMDPTCAKNFEGIAEGRSNRIRIKSDLNGDGVIDGAGEDITYEYDYLANSVERTDGNQTDTLIDGKVSTDGSTLEYYDGAGNELVPSWLGWLTQAQRTAVRRVRLVLTLQQSGVDPQNTAPLRATFSSNVDVRNRFFVTSTACP